MKRLTKEQVMLLHKELVKESGGSAEIRHEGDPDAIDTVLSHYAGYIRYCSKVHGKINTEVEEYVKQKLITALFKFRFDR